MARPHFKIRPRLNILHGHCTIKVEMILAVTILFTPLVGVYADYKSWCGNGSETEIDLIKSEDGVPGRYIAQWCSHGDRNITQWNLELRYLKDNRSPENCIEYDVYNVHPHADLHSRVEEAINLNFSCPIVCLAKPLDLLFSSCYTLKSRVKFNNLSQHNDTMHYIHNNLTLAHYKNSTTYVHKISNDEELVLVWHSGYIPITEYSVQLYMFNESLPEGERSEDITAACERLSWRGVRCARRAAAGRYLCALQHGAAWAHAAWLPSLYRWNFEHLTGAAPAPPAAASGVGTATLLAAAALAACAVAALAAVAHRASRRRKRVLRGWQAQRLQLESEMKLGVEEDIELLVLYAREARAQAAARALMELLRGAGAQVVDVHGAAAAARWAAAPAQRTRAALAAPNARILLLLSPALRLAKEDEDSVPAGAAPQFGDVLLQYALRMIAEAPPTGNPYKTLFVLTLPGATETEVQDAHTLAHLVPFARYPLPRAATALLRQLHLKATDTTLESFARSLAALPPETKLATNGAC